MKLKQVENLRKDREKESWSFTKAGSIVFGS